MRSVVPAKSSRPSTFGVGLPRMPRVVIAFSGMRTGNSSSLVLMVVPFLLQPLSETHLKDLSLYLTAVLARGQLLAALPSF